MATELISRKDILRFAPGFIAGQIRSLINSSKNRSIVLGLAGGRTIPHILDQIDLDWSRVEFFLADERLVPPEDKESNIRQIRESFLDKAQVPQGNIHPYMIDSGTKAYEEELRKYAKQYDIVILSAGEDGHVASLFPNSSVIDDSMYFLELHNSPKLPPDRMSMSRKMLLRSGIGIILFIGENKREAFRRFLDDSASWKDCPAKLVKELQEYYVLTDIEI